VVRGVPRTRLRAQVEIRKRSKKDRKKGTALPKRKGPY